MGPILFSVFTKSLGEGNEVPSECFQTASKQENSQHAGEQAAEMGQDELN